MLHYDEITGKMWMVQGDTARFKLTDMEIYVDEEDTYVPYTPTAADTLDFTVRKGPKSIYSGDPIIHVSTPGDKPYFDLPDTEGVPGGQYVYECRLTLENGDKHTILPANEFKMVEVVS